MLSLVRPSGVIVKPLAFRGVILGEEAVGAEFFLVAAGERAAGGGLYIAHVST